MISNGKRHLYIIGVSPLGSWKSYSKVYYRVYYDVKAVEGLTSRVVRRSKVAFTGLGPAGILATLAYVASKNYSYGSVLGTLIFIIPLTLLTIDSIYDKLESMLKEGNPNIILNHLCDIALNGVKSTAVTEENLEGNTITISNIEIQWSGDITRYNLSTSNNESEGVLPAVCSASGIMEVEGDEGDKVNINLNIYLIIVPLAMAASLQDKSSLLIFRERNVETANTGELMKASIIEGVLYALSLELEKHKREESKHEITDLILFYDTTHGLNNVAAALSETHEALTSITITTLYTLYEDSVPTLNVFAYNSDPVVGSKKEVLERTRTYNVSYYYSYVAPKKGQQEWAASVIRSSIDKILPRIHVADADTEDSITRIALEGVLNAYLVKVGLMHWGISGLLEWWEENKWIKSRNPIAVVKFNVNKMKQKAIWHIEYSPAENLGGGTSVSDVIMALRLTEALALLARDATKHLVYNDSSCAWKHHILCFDIGKLRDLANDALVRKANGPHGFLAYIIEPSIRAVLAHEADKLKTEPLWETIKYWVEKGSRQSWGIPNSCEDLHKMVSKGGQDTGFSVSQAGDCHVVKPNPLKRAEGPLKREDIRNFIAHIGVTRLAEDWYFMARNEERVCKALSICIERPLEVDILKEIASPL